jgi:hypothetical protein
MATKFGVVSISKLPSHSRSIVSATLLATADEEIERGCYLLQCKSPFAADCHDAITWIWLSHTARRENIG